MNQSHQLAKRFREVLLNGKWVVTTNYQEQLSNLDWKQATKKVETFNTIADLTFHIDYYIAGVLNALEGGTLDIKDQYSFDYTPPTSQQEWEVLRSKLIEDAEKFATLIEQMDNNKLQEVFVDEKYGNYQLNINAMIEHCYYHLGQIVLIKKLVTT
jgi:uncharacterized damage-inducible protein DinB